MEHSKRHVNNRNKTNRQLIFKSKMHQPKLSLQFILILVLISNVCWSQNLILKGTFKEENNTNLVYVNIGINSQNIGTISNENGHFI